MQIINQARTDFEYRLSSNEPIIRKTILSNKVKTNIIQNILYSKKYIDKKVATLFDTLTYKIVITNISCLNINNIYLQDFLSNNLKFVTNSLIVNGKKLRCLNPNTPIKLTDISPQSTIIISFKSIIIKTDDSNCIKNCSNIYFDYIYNVEKPPIQLKKYTNTVLTKISNNLFKDFNIESIIALPYCIKINNIIDIKAKVNIVKYKLVQTPIVNTLKHKEKSLCKLIIIGSIEYKIIYQFTNINPTNCFQYNFIDGFSTSILVPIGIRYVKNFDINIRVKNIDYIIINNSKLYLSSNLLLEVK